MTWPDTSFSNYNKCNVIITEDKQQQVKIVSLYLHYFTIVSQKRFFNTVQTTLSQ